MSYLGCLVLEMEHIGPHYITLVFDILKVLVLIINYIRRLLGKLFNAGPHLLV